MGDRSRLSFRASSCKQVSLGRKSERKAEGITVRGGEKEQERRKCLRAGWESEQEKREEEKKEPPSPITHDMMTSTSILYEALLVISLLNKNSACLL